MERRALPTWKVDIANHPGPQHRLVIDGYHCTIRRAPYKHRVYWLGYVHLPWKDRRRLRDLEEHLEVHGGVTFVSEDTLGIDMRHCNDAAPVIPGFDQDPFLAPFAFEAHQQFRTFAYVERELRNMVRQIRGIET